MYILLVILYLNGTGKAISQEQISFETSTLCEQAKKTIKKDMENSYVTSFINCLRVK